VQEQEKLAEAERRIEEARRTQAESLDLGNLGLSEVPASLRDLPHLKVLSLSSPFGDNPEFTDLSPLAGLQGLQSLDLQFCEGVTDLAPLAGLQALQNLDLSGTDVTDLAPLAGLQALQSLDLSGTVVTDLQPLAGLQELQSLDLQYCTGVTDLEPLARLQGLQSLDLQFCMGVTDLEPLARLQGLQSLNLLGCQRVVDLAPLIGLQGLQSLNLQYCRGVPATLLRIFADHPRLTKLLANEAAGVPREILSRGANDNCLPRLRTYFSELDLGAETENEVKVILLGNGRVGKTQLCRRFRGQPFDESVQSTHGVQIWRKELRIQTGGQEQAFQVNWWDFGGQDIYSATREHVSDLWSAPVNVGDGVNTAVGESRPSFNWHADTLLFGRAPGPEGMSDIYLSTREKVNGRHH